MAASLTGYLVTVSSKRLGEFRAAEIARQFQALITSSWTKCNRITLGMEPSSKWQRTASRTISRS